MVVLTNEGLSVGIVKRCVRCKQPRWRAEYQHPVAKKCIACVAKDERVKCRHCGGPAGLTSRGKHRKFCEKPECVRARHLHVGHVANTRRSKRIRALKTKRCPACEVTKPKTLEFFCAIARDDNGEVTRWHAWCRSCFNANRREMIRSNPELRAQALERRREYHRRQRELFERDPEAYRAHREHRKPIERASKERRAQATDDIPQRDTEPGWSGYGPSMPAAPLMTVLDAWMESEGMSDLAAAAQLGTSDRRFRDWRKPGATTRMSLVDAALVAMDLLWFDVYPPDQYPEVAAIWEAE